MKHFFGEWVCEDPDTEDSYTVCKRCGVRVRILDRHTTKHFWVDGKWTSKTPPCETLAIPRPVV